MTQFAGVASLEIAQFFKKHFLATSEQASQNLLRAELQSAKTEASDERWQKEEGKQYSWLLLVGFAFGRANQIAGNKRNIAWFCIAQNATELWGERSDVDSSCSSREWAIYQ